MYTTSWNLSSQWPSSLKYFQLKKKGTLDLLPKTSSLLHPAAVKHEKLHYRRKTAFSNGPALLTKPSLVPQLKSKQTVQAYTAAGKGSEYPNVFTCIMFKMWDASSITWLLYKESVFWDHSHKNHLSPSFNVKDRAVPQTSNPIFHSCFGRADMPGKGPIMHCTNTEMAALSLKIYQSQISPPGIFCQNSPTACISCSVQVTSEIFWLGLLSLMYSSVMAIHMNTQSHELQNLHVSTENLKSSRRKLDKHLGSFIPLVTWARFQLDVLPLRQNRTASQQHYSDNEGPPEKIWILYN